MFGLPKIPWGPLGIAGGSDTRPTNTPEDMASLAKTYADVVARNRTPQGRIDRGFAQFGPQPSPSPVPITPQGPPVSDGGYNAIDAQAANVAGGGYNAIDAQAKGPVGPTSVGGAPLAGYAGVTPQASPDPYGLAGRIRNASASLGGDDMGFLKRNTAMMRDQATGDFLDPQAGQSAQATGPDLIQKFMTYLHNK